MSNTEVACSQEATKVLDERRLNKMSYSNDITSRQELLILIKVLLNELEEKDPSKRAKTVRVVKECAVRNRIGQPEYQPLVPAVERRVKDLVGKSCWNRNLVKVRKAGMKERERQQTLLVSVRIDSMDYPAHVAQV